MVSAHMDDFEATGQQSFLNWLRGILAHAFGGEVKKEQEDSFIHTGIKAHQGPHDAQVPLRLGPK